MKQQEINKMLENHPYAIKQGNDGRWRTYVKRDDGSRKQIAKATKDKVIEFLYDFYKNNGVSSYNTMEELFPKWIKYMEMNGASPSYVIRLKKDFKNHYTGISKTPINQLTKQILDEWARELVVRVNNDKKQYRNVATIVKQMLDWAVDEGLTPVNAFRLVKLNGKALFKAKPKEPSETQVFTLNEIIKIIECARRDFVNGRCTIHKLSPLAILFAFQTGLRVGELCAIRYEDVKGDTLYVQRMYNYETKEVVNHTKAYRPIRPVHLTPDALEIIKVAKKYQQDNKLNYKGYIFSVNENPLSYYSIKKLLRKYCEEIGTINKSSHKIRKTVISTLFDSGININTICEMSGHNDKATTMQYYCFDRHEQEERNKQINNALSYGLKANWADHL